MEGFDPAPALAGLLTAFGVERVVAVDDLDRDSTFDSEQVAMRLRRGEIPLEDLLDVVGVRSLLEDRGVAPDDLAEVGEVVAESVVSGALSLGSPETPGQDTASAFTALQELLQAADVSFDVLHFDQWEGPASVDPATFMLFDFRHGQEPAGVRLAIEYVAQHGLAARVAILSQEEGEEQDLWSAHVASADAELAHQVVWIPKASLTAKPEAIIEQFAVALSAPVLHELRQRGLGVLRQALEQTASAASELNPYELHHLTVGAASEDGGFEPEALLVRFARRSLPIAVAELQAQPEVHTSIRQLRSVQEGKLLGSELTSALISLQRDDYFLSRRQLVGRHQGVMAGDIFALIPPDALLERLEGDPAEGQDPLDELLGDLSGCSLCILVTQPCDLAVRSNGSRASASRWLESLVISQPNDGDKGATKMGHAIVNNNQHIFRLPWLAGDSADSHRRAVYKKILSLPMLAVDACVWSPWDAGLMRLDEEVSPRLSVNWQARYRLMTGALDEIEETCQLVAQLDEADSAMVERIRLDAAASNPAVGFSYAEDGRRLSWGLARVGRLRSPYIESLLTTFNDFRRRDAFPEALA